MSIQVVYFSRTGTSAAVAKDIAMHLDLELFEIQDDMNWKGILGFLKGGYYASKNKPVRYHLFNVDKGKIENYYKPSDIIIVVTPLWAGGSAPGVRTFISDMQKQRLDGMGTVQKQPEFHLVVTSNGSVAKIRDGFVSVTDIVKSRKDGKAVVTQFVKTFKQRICPLCGGDNGCQHDAKACWCVEAKIPQGLIDRIPVEKRGTACICKKCVETYHREAHE